MRFAIELAVDIVIVAFIGLISAGAKHLHDGKCHEGHHDNAAYAAGQNKP